MCALVLKQFLELLLVYVEQDLQATDDVEDPVPEISLNVKLACEPVLLDPMPEGASLRCTVSSVHHSKPCATGGLSMSAEARAGLLNQVCLKHSVLGVDNSDL